MGEKREIWFRCRWRWLWPVVKPVHWKGYACYLLMVPGFGSVYFLSVIESILKGFFAALLLSMFVGGVCVVAGWVLFLDHMEWEK